MAKSGSTMACADAHPYPYVVWASRLLLLSLRIKYFSLPAFIQCSLLILLCVKRFTASCLEPIGNHYILAQI